ncbi:MAG: threonine--tRNA ligase [Clostridiales bacterium]|uniref:threonine--tRNA ligase n=1 Tax=Clostridium sp. N3C TaxID=1776758 RepID=UPI00092E0C51|nr:threonine--tRNA ligase [Clostridium sp. N3C]NLZ48231.1 threonine--tRNA ligase [Clostridiales bacterium]SCN22248.1 Threonine-tRNA ligase 1 [Clostridium sp. N3C]
MKVTLKDGSVKEFAEAKSVYEVAKEISEGLARVACAGLVDDQVVDLRYLIDKDCTLNILTFDDEEGKKAFRHTASHILAQAVKRLYPDTKLAIGPAIDNGFYYDFDKEGSFSAEDLTKLEEEMKKIVKEELPIERFELPRDEAIAKMKELKEDYKVELIEDLPEDAVISFYKQGDFVDLCAGPHLMNTKFVKAFKLTLVAGAYWKGDENNKMLTRIYGTAFTKKSDLEAHLAQLEEAKKRDHNKLGRELGLFTTVDVIGQGLPLLMPKGARVVQLLQRFVEDEEERRGYLLTKTPLMAKSDLYKISGHWDHYKDGMFVLGDESNDDEVMALRPMTCPFQFMIYNASQKSYRDLPLRYAETSTLFRNEASGEMHGLIRVRQFTISEGHLVVTPEQLEEEFKGVVDLINYMMTTLGIENDITYRFSKWDPNNKEKYINDPEAWEAAQAKMKKILDHLGINYKDAIGEAAFYGPKLDIQFKNVHGKEDTIITVQIDFSLAERFNMTYVDKDGEKKRPIIIHRTSIGCYERTLAMLIEKYAGAFPTWLAPVQVKVLPISEKYHDYTEKVVKTLKDKGIRVEGDYRAEKIGYKIREGRMERVPYLLIVGEKEALNNQVAVRSRKNGDEGPVDLNDFVERIVKEIEAKEK